MAEFVHLVDHFVPENSKHMHCYLVGSKVNRLSVSYFVMHLTSWFVCLDRYYFKSLFLIHDHFPLYLLKMLIVRLLKL